MKLKRTIQSSIVALSIIALAGVAIQPLNTTASAATTVGEKDHDAHALEIIENMIEAMGGRESIESIKSIKQTGTLSIPMAGLSGAVESYTMTPDKFLLKLTIPAMGETLQGLNGSTAWSSDAMNGPRVLPDDQSKEMVDSANLHKQLEYTKNYKSIKFDGETEFNEQRAYKINLVDNDGKKSTEYFSVESGLQIGGVAVTSSPMGETEVTMQLEDYKELGGHLQPTTIIQVVGPTKVIITISDAEYNKVDESVFELPDSVKALLKAQEESP